ACLELMAGDAIVAIQDMGAAGLTSSSFEMASKGGVGVELDLDRVPMREAGMSAYELMLSESQERMLMVLKEGREDVARAIFEKWEIDFAVVGRTTDSGRMVLKMGGDVVADLPIDPLALASPEYDRPWTTAPEPLSTPTVLAGDDVSPIDMLRRLLATPDLASKRWIWEQYDHMVMTDTAGRPGGDAAVVRVHGTKKALAITTDCTPRYCAADPVEGGKQAVAEAWRNLTAVGATPLAVTDCLNFGNPEKPDIMGQLVGCIEGMGQACRALDFPVVSGNVSLYNETRGKAILPTPAIGGVGLLRDLSKRASLAFNAEGDDIVLIGETKGHIGQSLYMEEIQGPSAFAPPPVDLGAERRNGDFVRRLIEQGRVTVCHDLSDGGLLVALAEMALAGSIGASVTPPAGLDKRLHSGWLFGEDQGRYLVTTDDPETLLGEAEKAGVPASRIGATGGGALAVGGSGAVDLAELRDIHEGWLPAYMASA
ncbi:MAG: phosphoribosylformylglycinamidine synthase subunit PurL, partial [Alphaproteobacteria bacterium]|nr:phosphoribosylformylglycinamidine synthase subunit PurL [Alphaproteobacteria bacterium]